MGRACRGSSFPARRKIRLMQKGKKSSHRYKILVILASVLLILLFDHLGFFEGTNQHLYDLSFRLRGPRPPSKDILLVEIQEETLKKLGRWPLRRLHYSSLLERVKQAEVVVLDVTLSESTGDDSLLERSIERHGKVILPVYVDNQMNLVSPTPTLGYFHRTGHVHLEEGIDGMVRDVYHTLVHQKEVIPSIASVAYEMVSRTSFQRMSPPPSDKSGKDIIQMDRMRINYCGPPGTCEKIFFPDVLNGVYSPAFFKGKMVLVGVAAIGLGDQFLTPFSQNRNYMPGIEVQANILNTLLTNNSIRVISPWILWPFVLLLSLLSYLFFLKVPEKKAALLGLVILIGITTTLYVLFSTYNLWLEPVVFYVTIVAVFWVTYVMKLEDAAKNLDRAYAEMLPQLRWKENTGEAQERGNGVSGILTPGGVQSKVHMLADVSHQLIFEKELTDHALLNHLHAVLLFGPDGKNVIVNELAVAYCEANSLDRTTAERFLKGIGPYFLDKHSFGVLDPQQGHITSMISLPLPQKRYIKLDASPIDGLDGKYLLFTLSDVTQIKELEALEKALDEIKKLKEQLEAENIYLREEVELKDGPKDIVGVSNPLKYVLHRIQQVACSKTTVLLTGETGTGKGLFARSLHEASDRRDKPFVNVNCAGLPPNLIESELFGREKGAFTGSTARQIGRFELANGGTIFLDEIGEFPLELQAKLLKVIEDGEFERLGSPHTVKVDVRIIASTNRHLEEEIKKGRFREDLFYRLNVFPITIPPLRQRKEDIPLIVKFYAERFSKSHGRGIKKIPTNTMKVLENYAWPGNVRELINVIERAVIVSAGPELRLAEKIDALPIGPIQEKVSQGTEARETKGLVEVEREHILRALEETGWRIEGLNGAAQLLGMNPSTMRARMRKLGIKRPRPR
jgi:transcriptional regulator with GAF, ATPase, and Fis domain/CHASE2 domain-containing sensor protein